MDLLYSYTIVLVSIELDSFYFVFTIRSIVGILHVLNVSDNSIICQLLSLPLTPGQFTHFAHTGLMCVPLIVPLDQESFVWIINNSSGSLIMPRRPIPRNMSEFLPPSVIIFTLILLINPGPCISITPPN